MLQRFGCVAREVAEGPALASESATVAATATPRLTAMTWALSIAALAWSLINFGLLLWMPATLVAKGYSMELSSRLLAASALIALPTVFGVRRWVSRMTRRRGRRRGWPA